MPMNRDARLESIVKKIEGGKEKSSHWIGRKEIEWKGELVSMDVFKLPIECLVYNKLNGRILSKTKSLEAQNLKVSNGNGTIDIESEEGKKLIEKMLYETHKSQNIKTEKNIRMYGQKEVGITSKDGFVIDGNRRLMFLNRISKDSRNVNPEKYKFFKTVVLPVSLAEAPDEIRDLETSYQMGEDEKLGYEPIAKYLRAQEFVQHKVPVETIALKMNESKSEILKYLKTIETMDSYLEYLEYEGMYTQLDGREDWFLALTKALGSFRGEPSTKAFDGYNEADVDDLALIFYDYIRAKNGGDGKKYRKIVEGLRDKHIFGSKEIWENFKKNHYDKVLPVSDSEVEIDFNSRDMKNHLDDRDQKFADAVNESLSENLNDRISELSNKQNHGRPEKLIKKASGAISEINVKAKSFNTPDVQRELKNIVKESSSLLCDGAVTLMLEQCLEWLQDLQTKVGGEDSEAQLCITTKINKLSHELKKSLGG